MSMKEDLAEERAQWSTAVCEGLIGRMAEHPALDPAGVVRELGDAVMVRALLVARVATLVSAGGSAADIVRVLEDSGVLAGPAVAPSLLSSLVGRVRRQLTLNGIADSVPLLGCGLRAWTPASTYRL